MRTKYLAIIFAISLGVLAADAGFVVAGTFRSWDRGLAYHGWQLVGAKAVRVVEAPSLIGVSEHSSRDFFLVGLFTVLLVTAVFTWKGYRWSALAVILPAAGASISATLLKVVIVRNGPPLTLWTPVGHSFPSGTAAAAAAFFGALAYLSLQGLLGKTTSRFLVTISIILTLVYLASALTYHYPSEVIGGLALGVAWLSGVLIMLWPALHRELSGIHSTEPGSLQHSQASG
jgi:membrane-associated phospholipid phosphatase